MAEVGIAKVPSLVEVWCHLDRIIEVLFVTLDSGFRQYVLPKVDETVEVPKVDSPINDAPEEAVKEAESLSPGEDNGTAEETPEVTETATEESNGTAEDEKSADQEEVAEETPEIKLETAPADFRFPTTNQTRHCFTRYIEYHRCVAAKGEGAPECDKFAKYYRSLCPGEWIDRWNEQRENGTFPGPL
ncbi:hypothetical protein QQ045_001991 [Rhodiola kirilowii]